MSQERVEQIQREMNTLKTQLDEQESQRGKLERTISGQRIIKSRIESSAKDSEMQAIKELIKEADEIIAVSNAALKETQERISQIQTAYINKSTELSEAEHILREENKQAAAAQRAKNDAAILERSILKLDLNSILDDYMMKRSERFSLKDKMSPADQIARKELIDTISTQLAKFVTTGNAEPVLATIKKGIADFPGFGMRAALNKVTVKLMDATLTPEAVDLETALTAMHRPQSTMWLTKYNFYKEKVDALENEIQKMTKYGDKLKNQTEKDVVILLASQLSDDLSRFKTKHLNTVPDPESFKQFSDKFLAKLHSQDDVIHKKTGWKTVVANVVAAVLTLGIALGVKLAHSKKTEGHAHLFFSKNEGERHIDKIDKAVKDIKDTKGMGPAPGA